jgi:hypothetical protein
VLELVRALSDIWTMFAGMPPIVSSEASAAAERPEIGVD